MYLPWTLSISPAIKRARGNTPGEIYFRQKSKIAVKVFRARNSHTNVTINTLIHSKYLSTWQYFNENLPFKTNQRKDCIHSTLLYSASGVIEMAGNMGGAVAYAPLNANFTLHTMHSRSRFLQTRTAKPIFERKQKTRGRDTKLFGQISVLIFYLKNWNKSIFTWKILLLSLLSL